MGDDARVPKSKKTPKTKAPAVEQEPVVPTGVDPPEDDVAEAGLLPERASETFPIVGLGASAGGLAAFEAFFAGMPSDTEPGMAFVLVQHLAPDHKSILSELVRRYTRMQVFDVHDGMVVQPNCIYIIPPKRDMALLSGALRLLDPVELRGHRLPIDYFFRTLAQDLHARAICVVLSGTGSDGTLGSRAVKAEGGMVMAQLPESCDYDGMPRSAIGTGLVDYILPPAEMAKQLIAYVGHAFGHAHRSEQLPAAKLGDAHNRIFVILRTQTGHDFSKYKQNTVARRIERRLAVHQIENLDDYVRYLQHTPTEAVALFHDLLIGVTSFFRDPAAFEALATTAIPRLLAAKTPGEAVRVWVPGCSTGEEAYSIAMLLYEQAEMLKQNLKIQIFATDIDGRAIDQARAGVYPASIGPDVSPERLTRFFTYDADTDTYTIAKSVRDLLVFSEQDINVDPPFSRLDLLSCRNLMIYMGAELQKALIPLFHYALRPGGVLFLGSSETVGDFTDLFSPLDRKYKLYRRGQEAHGAPRPVPRLPLPPERDQAAMQPADRTADARELPLRKLTERTLLQHYAAAGILVNDRGDILYLHGRTGQYLEPAPGEAALNILKMAREGLRRDLTTALHNASTQGQIVCRPDVRVKTNGSFTRVDLTVVPVTPSAEGPPSPNLYVVILAEAAEIEPAGGLDTGDAGVDSDTRIASLQRELRARDEHLQATSEELESTNEELHSSNEEMQSVNEEMQSTNEELETSKEELQSVNEELATVNAELQTKVNALSRSNDDLSNLMAASGIGTIFVDHHLLIQRFTPAVTHVINLIPTDVGRPVGNIVSNLVGYDRLVADVQAVLDDLIPREVEVQSQRGVCYLLVMRPYRTQQNVIEGVVITFTDISAIKQAQADLREAEAMQRLATVVRDSRDAIIVQDLAGEILAWNPAAVRMYGWSEVAALALNIRELVPEDQQTEALVTIAKLGHGEVLETYRTQRLTRDGRVVEIMLTATALLDAMGKAYAISTIEREYGV